MIPASLGERTKPTMIAVMKPDTPAMKRPIFWPMPSWTKFISELMRVVTSPDPRKSKNAMFWRKMARKYSSRICCVMRSPVYEKATILIHDVKKEAMPDFH